MGGYLVVSSDLHRGDVFTFIISFAGVLHDDNQYPLHIIKFVENCIGFTNVAIFAAIDFECGICASSEQRQFDNEASNTRIFRFFVLGCLVAFMESTLYIILVKFGAIIIVFV